ncbi:MAG: bifunctional diaminohydroxyphosphoribosylaminopyrimidine deaminase/5-amino-6-(5-phosphoribosylamino)uracil reductase RibD [Phycisphaeraceae bacterium]|nr:bifunctional diaminohydroxyphosphoribosylaminopyrimidine deaminase/5-amino-6-(5-phosphoribosylamino)uracil reductase RibD [Phycisphaeraceae bacterium]
MSQARAQRISSGAAERRSDKSRSGGRHARRVQGSAEDEAWMYQALAMAEQGHGLVEPNPMVGCVLVKDGHELGRGYHSKFGAPHAEAHALEDAKRRGESVQGATVYVTLEPCSHFGKTPPCADALVDAQVARVVIAMIDPNPRVAGQGIERLREAGIEVVVGVCQQQAQQLNEPFTKRVTTGLPWVIAKWASTLDGKVATHTGHSKWISSAASRRLVHEMRSRVDAVMVGVGTVLADDPRLTARDVEIKRVARRVVVDPELRMPPQSNLALGAEPGDPPVTIGVCNDVYNGPSQRVKDYTDHGISFMPLPRQENQYLEVEPLLRHLAEAHNATNVLVEGGAALIGSMLDQGLVDQVLAFVAPKLLGDERATPAITGQLRDTIDQSTMLELRDVERIDDDAGVR